MDTDMDTDNNQVDSSDMPEEDELTRLSKQVVSLEAQIKEGQDKYLRLYAEFDNYKKRMLKEQSELKKYLGEKIFLDLLNVVDNFERAQQFVENSDEKQYRAGIELIYKDFINFLNKWEVRGESALSSKFDPAKHNAISKVPSGNEPEGTIVGELKKAFFYKDKLLRVGEVVVSAGNDN